ncbi:hypothetical protein TDB9533_02257 [Thalassocella blandensis]|nr:hypothetical protein TDB9533_02257 [Thalassocella blandensis]
MIIDFSTLPALQVYQSMTQTIIPRPIAWVLTDNGIDGAAKENAFNLAPFSYFTAVSSDPALVMLSVGKKSDGELKDTRRNIIERKHCVIHIAHDSQGEALNASAATLAHGDSEIEKIGIALETVEGWSLPRVKDCPVAMYCTLYDIQEIGPNKQGLLFCEVKALYVDDKAVTYDSKQRMKFDAQVISPLSRLGASDYASFGEVFSLARPN